MAEALAAVPIAAPPVPVVVNVRAEAVTEPDRILRPSGRAGHRVGALARKRAVDGRGGRHRVLGDRRGQGAVRHDQAHRRKDGRPRRASRQRPRMWRRPRRAQGLNRKGTDHVRSDRQDRAGDRRLGRHRRRDRPGAAWRGGDGRPVGHAGGTAGGAGGRTGRRAPMCCPATCRTPRRSRRC